MSGRGAWRGPLGRVRAPKGEHRMHGYATRVSVITLLALLLGLLVVLSVSLGASRLPFRDVIAALFGAGEDQTSLLIHKLRLPRVLVAALVGSALGAAGAVMQGVFRNPLASPDIMGVNGGASVAAVAFLTLTGSRYSIYWLPAVAIAGAFIAAALIYLLGWKRGASPIRLVLIGVGIATAMSALTTFLLISGPAFKATQVLNWLSGTIYGLSTPHLLALLPWVAVLLPIGWLMSRHLDVLALGDATAAGLGNPVQRTRLVQLLISVALAGGAVGIAGGIGFVGLMAPHMARMLVGIRYGTLIPVSALVGAIIVVGSDMAGRLMFMPYDLPAGIFTAAIGAPFFFYLLYTKRQFGN
ncbi:FecCD family ABC transporter permease [Paenibacillus lautus]|uniref:FecCD family ABC transporter permease n=1 Tax=Paenibacillus lautus TaxID=1401 RepID=UPI00398826B7